MAQWTLVMYDIPTAHDEGDDLNNFRKFLKSSGFDDVQESVYIIEGIFHNTTFQNAIEELPANSDVRIVQISDQQKADLQTNHAK